MKIHFKVCKKCKCKWMKYYKWEGGKGYGCDFEGHQQYVRLKKDNNKGKVECVGYNNVPEGCIYILEQAIED